MTSPSPPPPPRARNEWMSQESSSSPPSSSSPSSSSSSSSETKMVDNSSTLINKIANLYAERLMSDVTLLVGSSEYFAHRLILCASSDVFQIMLMNSSWAESQEKRVILKEPDSSAAVFEEFLKYLYTGKIQLDYATVIPVVSLADKYNVKDLLKIGLYYMARNVSTACKRNQVVSWYQFTAASGHMNVADPCRDFIKSNFKMISDNIDFPNMELSCLLSLLQCNDLVIDDEMTLFRCVDRWLCAQREIMVNAGEDHIDLHLDRYVQAILPCIRFPMMTPSQLADLILNPLCQSHMQLMMDKIRPALYYHKNQLPQPSELKRDPSFDARIFTPRLYTTEKYCASLVLEHLHNLQSYHCRSLVFTSQCHTAEAFGEEQSDWTVDVFPKGVWIQKCLTVYRPPGLEVPGRVLKTVRVAISSRSSCEKRVKVAVLFIGCQDGFEHVRKVVTRNYCFSENDQVLNFDDVLDWDELNNVKQRSYFLGGNNSFKIKVVVAPLTNLSCHAVS